MRIRAIKEEDSKEIFIWRNDELSRDMFIDDKLITFNEHKEWFKKAINDQDIDFYIGENEICKLGIVRFNFNSKNKFSEISININPSMRNKSYGKELLLNAIKLYLKKKNCILKAKIKSKNEISIRLFKSLGFKVISKNSKFYNLEYLSHLSFKKVDSSCTKVLYSLLKERIHFISHEELPSYEKHKDFVNSNPYLQWYIFSIDTLFIGSFYIKDDNSIGINIKNPSILVLEKVISFINKNFQPNAGIASIRPNYFFINVAVTNDKMKKILKEIGILPIQISYKLENL
tara:strand:- start:7136 stop:7999 length:864 start_codon:yes stop_codon:yes gene_type:complete